MQVDIVPYDLIFKSPAGTSRGILRKKRSWFLITSLEEGIAVGECGLFAGLSSEDLPEFDSVLERSVQDYQQGTLRLEDLRAWPSIRCGWEMLLADIEHKANHQLCPNDFSEGTPILINGLVWMGTKAEMSQQIDEKLAQGFSCIKLKIGGIDFEEELSLLAHIRSHYSAEAIEIRLDANGAFSVDEALEKLGELATFDIHSIEQPIRQGQWDEMASLCIESPIAIALDEELIGLHQIEQKKKMIAHIAPQYVILKPSLVGGFAGSDEWVSAAESAGIAWWATSALESNIGLNAIAQWTASKSNPLPQGLGTGALYSNNFPSPLHVEKAALCYNQSAQWDLSLLTDA